MRRAPFVRTNRSILGTCSHLTFLIHGCISTVKGEFVAIIEICDFGPIILINRVKVAPSYFKIRQDNFQRSPQLI